ncbi:hypothetical protein BsWGS_00300 [Bradybaena similaris]
MNDSSHQRQWSSTPGAISTVVIPTGNHPDSSHPVR